MESKIILGVDIAAPADKVFGAITTRAGLAGWYTPEVNVEGASIELRFGQLMTLRFIMEDVEKNRRIVWSGVDVPDDWKRSRITFTMAGNGDTTQLTFIQDGLPSEYPDLGVFSYLWAQYLRSIKVLLETGTGEPFGSEASRQAGTTPVSV